MKKGIFITLEGSDGCGKTTQAPKLAAFLRQFGPVVHTRQPGGSPFAERLRKIILDPALEIAPVAELMLYEAARAQHVADTLVPALKKGAIVLCERYIDATLAYQGYGRQLDLKMIKQLNQMATNGLMPHLTLVLDIPLAESLHRTRARSGAKDRMENASLAFHRRVSDGYRELAKKFPRRVKLVSGIGSVEDVQKNLQDAVCKFLKR